MMYNVVFLYMVYIVDWLNQTNEHMHYLMCLPFFDDENT